MQLEDRHALDRSFMKRAAFAPAFGMIGTLIGLILMLGNMQDVDVLASGMAVALIHNSIRFFSCQHCISPGLPPS